MSSGHQCSLYDKCQKSLIFIASIITRMLSFLKVLFFSLDISREGLVHRALLEVGNWKGSQRRGPKIAIRISEISYGRGACAIHGDGGEGAFERTVLIRLFHESKRQISDSLDESLQNYTPIFQCV